MKRKMKFCILYGSKKSKKICDTYAEQEKRIRVIHQKNQGVSSARNAGLDASAGKYITFADADDWMDTTLFQKCFDVLSENPADVLYHAVKKDIWNKEETKSIIKGLPSISGMVSRKQNIFSIHWKCRSRKWMGQWRRVL